MPRKRRRKSTSRRRKRSERKDISSGAVMRALTVASNAHTGITIGRAIGRGLAKIIF